MGPTRLLGTLIFILYWKNIVTQPLGLNFSPNNQLGSQQSQNVMGFGNLNHASAGQNALLNSLLSQQQNIQQQQLNLKENNQEWNNLQNQLMLQQHLSQLQLNGPQQNTANSNKINQNFIQQSSQGLTLSNPLSSSLDLHVTPGGNTQASFIQNKIGNLQPSTFTSTSPNQISITRTQHQTGLPISSANNFNVANNLNPAITSSLPSEISLNNQQISTLFSKQNQQIWDSNKIPTQDQFQDLQKQMLSGTSTTVTNKPKLMLIPGKPIITSMEYEPQSTILNQPQLTSLDNQVPLSMLQNIDNQNSLMPQHNQLTLNSIQRQPVMPTEQNQLSLSQFDSESLLLPYFLLQLQSAGMQNTKPTNRMHSKHGSKSNIKALLPLIFDLLKENDNTCGCHNCGCKNNKSHSNVEDPTIHSGYSNQKNYEKQQSTNEKMVMPINDSKLSSKLDDSKNERKNTISNIDSEETSAEEDYFGDYSNED